MFCSQLKHRLRGAHEIRTGECYGCHFDRYGADSLKQFLIKNVAGCKCPDYHCSVTMGCGWIGSHHGGSRMTCGKCSSNGNYHPGMSDAGFETFNYVINHRSNITSEERSMLIAQQEQERLQKEQQERAITLAAKEYKLNQILKHREHETIQRQEEHDRQEKYKQEAKLNIIRFTSEIKQSNDNIMKNINSGHGYVFYFRGGELYNIQYQFIQLKPVTSYCCFIKFKYSDHKTLLKLFVKALQDDRMYKYNSIDDIIRIYAPRKNSHYHTFTYCNSESTAVLVYKNGQYGLISI
jgi:hypothetical protein